MIQIKWSNMFIIAALALAAAGVLLPQPAAPVVDVGMQSFQCAPSAMCVTAGGKVVTFPSGSTLTVDSGATFIANTLDVTTLKKSGVSFTGATKYGTAATYTSGSSVTHGFATTPTMCMMLPARDVTSTLTITATGFSSDRATQATPIYWICGQ